MFNVHTHSYDGVMQPAALLDGVESGCLCAWILFSIKIRAPMRRIAQPRYYRCGLVWFIFSDIEMEIKINCIFGVGRKYVRFLSEAYLLGPGKCIWAGCGFICLSLKYISPRRTYIGWKRKSRFIVWAFRVSHFVGAEIEHLKRYTHIPHTHIYTHTHVACQSPCQ